jgi:hypothetical protein
LKQSDKRQLGWKAGRFGLSFDGFGVLLPPKTVRNWTMHLQGAKAPGYSFLVLGQPYPERVRGKAGLWAIHYYPCPETEVQAKSCCLNQTFNLRKLTLKYPFLPFVFTRFVFHLFSSKITHGSKHFL